MSNLLLADLVVPFLGSPPLSAGLTLPFLQDIVVLLVLGTFIAYLSYRAQMVPITGFLVAGVLIGPSGLGLVGDIELVDQMAEVGVILLLFTIGLEFSLEKLARMKRAIFAGGGIQVTVTAGFVIVICLWFGAGWGDSIYTGCLVALSSTAIVLGVLTDRAELETPYGQASLATLIFQDLAVVAMVLIVPVMGTQEGSTVEILRSLGQAIVVVGAVVWLARKVVPWLLRHIAETRRQELFVMAVGAICLGTAWLTSLVGVSLALGAFLAGLVVSESDYREHALSEILPFRSIFSAVFFVSVGMLLDLSYAATHPLLLLGIVVGVFLLKSIVTSGAFLSQGYPLRVAVGGGVALAQVGEFSFVLSRTGEAAGLAPAGLAEAGQQLFIASTVLLMMFTPFMVSTAPRIGSFIQKLLPWRPARQLRSETTNASVDLDDHVILIGYGPAGRHLARVLDNSGIPLIVLEMNPKSVRDARDAGFPALYGDAARRHLLKAAHIEQAKLCVVVINDREAAQRITRLAHEENPTLQVIVRSRYVADIAGLEDAGADEVVTEELETTLRLFSRVLGAYRVSREKIQQYVSELRADDYRLLRDQEMQEAHRLVLEGLDAEGLHTRAVRIRDNAPIAGRTLREVGLRQRYGLTVLAIRRDDDTIGNPAGDFKLNVDDRLVMVGTSDQFVKAGDLFRER